MHHDPLRAEVVDREGQMVGVDGRGTLTSTPHQVRIAGGSMVEVAEWAGPWTIDERWWDPGSHRRRARFQMVTTDGVARMFVLEGRRWWVAAVYD